MEVDLDEKRVRPENLMRPRGPGSLGKGMRRRVKTKRTIVARMWKGKERSVMSGLGGGGGGGEGRWSNMSSAARWEGK